MIVIDDYMAMIRRVRDLRPGDVIDGRSVPGITADEDPIILSEYITVEEVMPETRECWCLYTTSFNVGVPPDAEILVVGRDTDYEPYLLKPPPP